MLKGLCKRALEVKKVEGDEYPSLSIDLIDNGLIHEMSKSDLITLLKESIYLLRDELGDEIETKLIKNVIYWNIDYYDSEEEMKKILESEGE